MAEKFTGDLAYGVMTSAMPFLSLEDSVALIKTIPGAREVELSSIDSRGTRAQDKSDHTGSHLPVYEFIQNPRETAKRFAGLFNEAGLGVTLGNYDRIHSGKQDEEKRVLDYMLRVIDFAAALGGKEGGAYGVNVGMFWGWDRKKGIPSNLESIARKVYTLAQYAHERNVVITTENCHMPGGWPDADELRLPQQVMRSGASTLAARLMITAQLREWGISQETFGYTWDPSHPQTEGASAIPEARRAFVLEPIRELHAKEHDLTIPEELERIAYFGGLAMPGWFADKKSKFYRTAQAFGIPIGNNSWAQQYGRVKLPGVGAPYASQMRQVIEIGREHGFDRRVIAENETPEKNEAVGAKDSKAIADMYSACHEFLKPALYADGVSFKGRAFKPLNADEGVYLAPMTWAEARKQYRAPDRSIFN